MKYIFGLIIIVAFILYKPWKFVFHEDIQEKIQTDSIGNNDSSTLDSLQLLPANQVINNNDSELEIAQKFDKAIQKFINKWEIKGASFALMKDDRLIYSKGYGYADWENQIPMDVMHVFRIASISKLVTAVGIMKLQEEGKLSISDKVFGEDGILNDSIYSDIKDKRTKNITIENLLRHQGGFTLAYGDPMFNPLLIAEKMNVAPPADLNTIIRFVLSRRLGFTPGHSTSYSNIGYGILSKVIEKVSGQDYETYIRKNILIPAGCFDMHLGKNYSEDRLPNEVKYYEVAEAEEVEACDGSGKMVLKSNGGNNVEALYGAGGWVASPSELLRFLATIDNDSTIPDILSKESIDYMTQRGENGGLPIGWMEARKDSWLRSGTLAGTSALMKHQNNGYAWVFLTNTSTWKGSRFPSYINRTVTDALATVKEWPQRDLFEFQNMNHEKLLVSY